MQEVLIIGAANLVHTVNFIECLLTDNSQFQVTLFNTEHTYDIAKEFASFYEKNNVLIVNTKHLSESKNSKIKSIQNFFNMSRALFNAIVKKKHFDFCFVLYCSWQTSVWVSGLYKYFEKIVLVYFGSDVLRNRKLKNFFYSKMNHIARHIVLPNLNAKKIFNEKTENLFAKKSCVIQYPQKMTAVMQSYLPLHNLENDREFFGFPQDKIVVLCGHTATNAEQYEELIESLSNCREDVLDRCFFVFMMTYAPGDYREYQNKISEILKKSNLNGTVLTERIEYEDMPKLHYSCDAHITTIKTDAFSCFLQEELLAGNVLIYGKWLNYFEIENENFYAIPVDSVSKVYDAVNYLVDNFDECVDRSAKNKSSIIDIASEEAIRNEWNRIIFEEQ